MKLYSIKDVKVGFMSPVMRKNDEQAIRDYKLTLNSPESNIFNSNPEDYELWRVADFNEDTGAVTPELQFVFSAVGDSNA